MKLSIVFIGLFIALCKGQERIAGGGTVTINSFPYAAALLTNSGAGSSFRHACGGTIVAKSAILSAASCFHTGTTANPEAWWRARIGSSFSNAGGTIHLVSQIFVNPSYQPGAYENDIAVLRTRFDMQLVPGVVEQAFLPGAAYPLNTNQALDAIGWGANAAGSWSEQLQRAEIFVVDQTTCTNRYNTEGVSITANMVCAGWLDVGVRGQCAGDVGGPLLIDGTVVGVFSHSAVCADDWLPAINTRVSRYTAWVVDAAIA